MINEIITQTHVIPSGAEVSFGTLTTPHQFTQITVEGAADARSAGTVWRLYSVTPAGPALIWDGELQSPTLVSKRLVHGIEDGARVELRGFNPGEDDTLAITASLVGSDPGCCANSGDCECCPSPIITTPIDLQLESPDKPCETIVYGQPGELVDFITITLPPDPVVGESFLIVGAGGNLSVVGGANPLDCEPVFVENGTALQFLFSTEGKWISLWAPSPCLDTTFSTQAVWHINPVTGNNNSSGKTAMSALKTEKELFRRWGCCGVLNPPGNEVTVFITGGLPSSDPINFNVSLAPGKNLYWKSLSTTTLHAGTAAVGTVDIDRAINQQWELKDAAVADDFWSGKLGKRLRITSGPNEGAQAYVLSDLNFTQIVRGVGGFAALGHTSGFVGGETLEIKFGTSPNQTVTFAATDQTIQEVKDAINTQLVEPWGPAHFPGVDLIPTVSNPDPQLYLQTENAFYNAFIPFDPTTERIRIIGGTALAALGLSVTVTKPKTCRTTEWAITFGDDGFNEAGHGPSVGDTYVVEELATIHTGSMQFNSQGGLNPDTFVPGVFFRDFTILGLDGFQPTLPTATGGANFAQSVFFNSILPDGARANTAQCETASVFNCLATDGLTSIGAGSGVNLFTAGGLLGLKGNEPRFYCSQTIMGMDNNYIFQGSALVIDNGSNVVAGGMGQFQVREMIALVSGSTLRMTDFFISFSVALYGTDFIDQTLAIGQGGNTFEYERYPNFGSSGIAPSADGLNSGAPQISNTFVSPASRLPANAGVLWPAYDLATNAYTTNRATSWTFNAFAPAVGGNIARTIAAGGFVQSVTVDPDLGTIEDAVVCLPMQSSNATFKSIS